MGANVSSYPTQPFGTQSNCADVLLFISALIVAATTAGLAIVFRTIGFDSEMLAQHQTVLATVLASVVPASSAAPRSMLDLKSVAEAESPNPPREAGAEESPAAPLTPAEATPAATNPTVGKPVEEAPVRTANWSQIQLGKSTIMTQVDHWNPDGTVNFESQSRTTSVRDNGDTLTLTEASGARATFRVTATPGITQCEGSAYRITEPFPPFHGVVCVEAGAR